MTGEIHSAVFLGAKQDFFKENDLNLNEEWDWDRWDNGVKST